VTQTDRIYVGIDLAIAKAKRLPVVMCQWREGRCVPLPLKTFAIKPPRGPGNLAVLDPAAVRRFVSDARKYITEISDHLGFTVAKIAIDAPSHPGGGQSGRRASERALDRAGISCFPTPTTAQAAHILSKVREHAENGGDVTRLPHANQLWMFFGFQLFRGLSSLAPCIEVYPQLTVQLLGVGQTHKSRPGAVATQLAEVARHTGWPAGRVGEPLLPEIGFGAPHDLLDAYLAAWVAALPESRRVAYGDPPADVIWAPAVQQRVSPSHLSERSALFHPETKSEERRLNKTLLCPGCGQHTFKRWPLGWDAHAAHRCIGITGAGPEARKKNFKRMFRDYFSQ
jgi:hypothetical protein